MLDIESRSRYGLFLDFPVITHYSRRVRHSYSDNEFKRRLIAAIVKLNRFNDVILTSSAGRSEQIKVDRSFDVGVADGLEFVYLDENETKRLLSVMQEKTMPSLDLIIFVHYRYKMPTGKIASLLFDQYFLRIGFKGAVFTFSREKGLARTSPEEILNKLVNFMINTSLDNTPRS
ncbi:MAG: hypothetical protein ACTSW4_03605 [Candidatus Ranarchaeia archaeon]